MKHTTSLILALVLSGCVQLTPNEEQAYARAVVRGASFPTRQPYDPDVAVGLSMAFPGLGHLYLGEGWRAVVWCLASIAMPGCAPVAAWSDARELDRRQIAQVELEREQVLQDQIADEKLRRTIAPCRACQWEFPITDGACPRCGLKRP